MPFHGLREDERLSVSTVPATPAQRRVALAFSLGIACAAVFIGYVGLIPMPRSDGFIPAVQAIIAAIDFITAVLLFGQYATERSRALLVLGAGYLFTCMIVVAHTLTFPGAFTPEGLLGAGRQTSAWLYVVWHLALPAAALAYARLKTSPTSPVGIDAAPALAIRRTVLLVVPAAVMFTWVAIVAGDALPTLVLTARTFASTASVVTALPFVASVIAFVVLWRRRTSVLDEWLLVALVASMAETALVVFVGASRYTFAFYASRPLAVVAACAVLVALLSEMASLYVRLSTAVKALQRERANKLMNLDVVVSSIAHEIKQPLMVITTCSAVIENLLRKPKIDLDEVRLNLRDVTSGSMRIGETIDSLRGLFRNPQEAQRIIDVNELALESLKTLDAEISANQIAVSAELDSGLPQIIGHRGQLREVLVNIVQNAIDELAPLHDRARMLRVRTTSSTQRNRVSITIEDSGRGIAAERLPSLFTAFVTTKVGGMGLGLSLCQMIVDRHNGQLSVSSDLGKGTRFEVSLPAEPVAAAAPGADAGAGAARVRAGSLSAEA
jgi:signal transduction histidine kinase